MSEGEDENAHKEMTELVDAMTKDHYRTIIDHLGRIRHADGLTNKKFRRLLSDTLGVKKHDKRLILFANKINRTDEEYYTKEMFLNYILHHLREKEVYGRANLIPFQDVPVFKQNIYSKQSPCKMLPASSLPFIFTVSKDGVITTWSQSLVIQKGTIVDDKASMVSRTQLARLKRANLWVTDATLMTAVNVLVVSTTSRELNFYDVSTSNYKCQSRLCDLPRVPLCLSSYAKPTGETYVMYGDECGNISILVFHNPDESLFVTESKDIVSALEDIQMVLYSRLPDHSEFVTLTVLDQVHHDWVYRILYVPYNHSIISCCSSPDQSLVYRHFSNKRNPYIFNVSKGISCFDYSHQLDLLVTGSADHVVRFWDPYVTARPTAIFTHHRTPLVDVLIHGDLGVVFSFSRDATLCVWSIRDHTLIQITTVKFPFSQRQPEYSHRTLFLLSPSILTITCNEFIAEYKLGVAGTSLSSNSGWGIVSHPKPVTAAVYDSLYDQVVSGCEGGEIIVWNLMDGNKLLRMKEAHGDKEITSLVIDGLSKRVLTGSSNGEVKVWNHLSGECLKYMVTPGNVEVTGIVHHNMKQKFLTTGWNKRITSYSDTNDIHVFNLYPEDAWRNCDLHKDDVTTMALCNPHYLATGSFDGVIVIWNTETEKPIATMRSKKARQLSSQRPPSNRRRSGVSSRGSLFSGSSSHSISSSRRLSVYSAKAQRTKLEYIPVDKLLFLKTRMASRLKGQATLVSSEGGRAGFWVFPGESDPIGSFSLSRAGEERNVLDLCTDASDQFLIAGDVYGYVSVFDISTYCNGFTKNNSPPKCLATWRSHSAEILSVACISHSSSQQLVLTASADHTVRLWTLKGHYIGTFGQTHTWDLADSSTFQHPKTPWGEMVSNSLVTLTEHNELSADDHNKNTASDPVPSVVNNMSDKGGGGGNKLAETGKESVMSLRGTSGSSSLISSQSSLPPIMDNNLYKQYSERVSKRMESKVNRRQNYSGIDMKSTERFGTQCAPYQALQLLSINDTSVPTNISEVLNS